MYLHETFEGKYIFLKSVEKEDAEFIIEIRTDNTMNHFVHKIFNDVEREKKWICNQQKREGDYFFSITRKRDGKMLGNISIYNIKDGTGELGRWLSYGNAIENLESVVMAHDFAFDILQLDSVYTRTISENKKVVSFWKRFGGIATENVPMENTTVYHNTIPVEQYKNKIRPRLVKMLGE